MNISQRIIQEREKKGWNQSELARALTAAGEKVTPQSVQQWERGETTPRAKKMQAMAQLFGVDVSWLQFGEESNIEAGPDIKGLVPLISWIQAGNWCNIEDPYQPGEAEEWLPCPVPHSKRTIVLRVRGISMEPKFHDGELIFVDPDVQPENKKFVIVRLDDSKEATFKQLIVEGGRRFLKPLNPQWPDPIIEVSENATICGVVIFKGEKL